jgi:hypothetical protein
VRPLKKPIDDALTVFVQCASGVKSDAHKAKLLSVAPLIQVAAFNYETFASNKALYLLTRELSIGGTVTITEMKELYSGSMSGRSGAARPIYDGIVDGAPNRVCPLCGVGTVSSLDHHLPQSKYPDYVVIPANLIPSCADCNKAKFTKFPKTPGEQTIHPYFDDYTQETWLHAEVVEMSPPALSFRADGPAHWDSVDRQRVKRHFDVFKLGRLFTSNAGNELGSIRSHLVDSLQGNQSAIKLYLKEQAATCRAAYRNSWRTAAYEALTESDWFVAEGFREIPARS